MIKKIILTIIGLVVVASTLIIVNLNSSNDITVSVEIVKEDVRKEISLYIKEDSSFIKEISLIYELDIEDGFLYKIDFLECYEGGHYIAIYVNDLYSRYGVTNLKLNDNDKVSFIYTKL